MALARQIKGKFPAHGWIGLGLVLVVWPVNWILADPLPLTAYVFCLLWLGYALTVDGLNVLRSGTSLLTRSPRQYMGLFIVSAPVWWLFEIINWRTQNWSYPGEHLLPPAARLVFFTLSFSTVIPAVFGTAELVASAPWLRKLGRGPVIRPTRGTTWTFFILGILMFGAMMAWPKIFFPFAWMSLYFLLAPINVWLGNRSLSSASARADWRPMVAIWIGTLICGLFWEMWNWYSFPKWVYSIPWADWFHIFEMPLLGYVGYLPFGMELFAMYHFAAGLFGSRQTDYVAAGLGLETDA